MNLRAALFAMVFSFPALVSAQSFTFNDPNSRDTVAFVLDAPLETINGLSNTLNGKLTVAGDKVSGELRVPVKSIKTGNGIRDGHLQNDRWLDAAKHPDIVVTFKDVALASKLEDGKPVTVDAKAKFTVRGVALEHPVKATLTYMKESDVTKIRAAGDLLRVRAKFAVPLEKHGIKRDGPLLLKVGEVAEVSADAWGSTKFTQ